MSRHTAGPWDVGTMLNPANARAIIGDGDTVVAIMPSEWNDCTFISANARLIAAAPELLEALQEIVALENTETDEWDAVERLIPEMVAIARAAITRATQPLPTMSEEV